MRAGIVLLIALSIIVASLSGFGGILRFLFYLVFSVLIIFMLIGMFKGTGT